MFCHGGPMQIAGANLLVAAQAAQQAARARPATPLPKPETASFQPLDFAKAGTPAAMPKGAGSRPGMQLDITV